MVLDGVIFIDNKSKVRRGLSQIENLGYMLRESDEIVG